MYLQKRFFKFHHLNIELHQNMKTHTAISFKPSAERQSRTAPQRSINDPSSRMFDSPST